MTSLKKVNKRAHWTIARGNAQRNKDYCSKDGDFEERGQMSEQGKHKLDMVKAVEEAAEGKSTRYMVDTHGAGYIINKRKIDETAEAIKQEQVLEEQREEMRQTKLK